jgi:hypothetical protein
MCDCVSVVLPRKCVGLRHQRHAESLAALYHCVAHQGWRPTWLCFAITVTTASSCSARLQMMEPICACACVHACVCVCVCVRTGGGRNRWGCSPPSSPQPGQWAANSSAMGIGPVALPHPPCSPPQANTAAQTTHAVGVVGEAHNLDLRVCVCVCIHVCVCVCVRERERERERETGL